MPVLIALLGLLFGTGLPKLETDLLSSSYLRTDGEIGDSSEMLRVAVDAEARRSAGKKRRLHGRVWSEERRLSSERSHVEWKLFLYYEARRTSIFDPRVLADIAGFEKRLASLPSYRKFCHLESAPDGTSVCRGMRSALRFLYGPRRYAPAASAGASTYAYTIHPGGSYPDGDWKPQGNISATVGSMQWMEEWGQWKFPRLWYFSKDFPKNRNVMRSQAEFGTPLQGFRHRRDRAAEQADKYSTFIAEELYPLLRKASTKHLRVYYDGPLLRDYELGQVVLGDALKALVSLALVWLYMVGHTRAPLMALAGMAVVVTSIPCGTFLFCMLGHDSFPIVNVLSLFLLLGIGADHIFILDDAWIQNEDLELRHRLRATLGRAGKPIIACSGTSAMSFLANIWSPIRPLRWFGLFVGFCVLCNMFLSLAVFPPLLVLRSGKPDKSAAYSISILSRRRACVERFFNDYYALFLFKFRFLVLGLGCVLCGACFLLVLHCTEVSREPPHFFTPGTHNLGDVGTQKKLFDSEKYPWTFLMESRPLQICAGCSWLDEVGSVPRSCKWLGPSCASRPCVGQPGVADPHPCAGHGVCGSGGICACQDGLLGPDCRANLAVQCQLGAWTPTTPCSASCGVGQREETRPLLSPESICALWQPIRHRIVTCQSTCLANSTSETSASLSTTALNVPTVTTRTTYPMLAATTVPTSTSTLTRSTHEETSNAPTPSTTTESSSSSLQPVVSVSALTGIVTATVTVAKFFSTSSSTPTLRPTTSTSDVTSVALSTKHEPTTMTTSTRRTTLLTSHEATTTTEVFATPTLTTKSTTSASSTLTFSRSSSSTDTTMQTRLLTTTSTAALTLETTTESAAATSMQIVSGGSSSSSSIRMQRTTTTRRATTTTTSTSSYQTSGLPTTSIATATAHAGVVWTSSTTGQKFSTSIGVSGISTSTSTRLAMGSGLRHFRLTLHGLPTGTLLTSLAADILVSHLSRFLSVAYDEITLRPEGPHLRIAESSLILAVQVNVVGILNVTRLEEAVDQGVLLSQLSASDMFFSSISSLSLIHINAQTSSSGPPLLNTSFTVSSQPQQPAPAPQPPPTVLSNGLPTHAVAKVSIVFGLKSVALPHGTPGNLEPILDGSFRFSLVTAQEALDRICKEVMKNSATLAVRSALCVIDRFKEDLESQNINYPVRPPSDVNGLLYEFAMKQSKSWKGKVGFSHGRHRVQWVQLVFVTNLANTLSADEAWKWYERWDAFIQQQRKAEAGTGVGHFFQTCDLWVRAELERRLVSSTLPCAVMSLGFSLFVVVASLKSVLLAFYVMFSIFLVIICLLAFLFGILGWTFGALEAVALIVFFGSSIDYTLHVAESFTQAPSSPLRGTARRFQMLQMALAKTGGAVLAAAITTTLAGIPILFCTIRVFARFGAALMANTMFSLLCSLCIFSAILAAVGPVPRPRVLPQEDADDDKESVVSSDERWPPPHCVGKNIGPKTAETRRKTSESDWFSVI